MIPNPLARHRRLGERVRALREARGQNHAALAADSGVSSAVVSRVENPFGDLKRRPSARLVRKLLDALEVTGDEYDTLLNHAGVAAAGGWWDAKDYEEMGAGQLAAAVVEIGASVIDEYAGTLLPGLVQTEEAARCRSVGPHVDAVVAGRMERQRQIGEARYRLILEEQAVRRWPVPGAVMLDQLHHLLKLAERPSVSIRILPVDADLGEGIAPRAPFAHMTYPDSLDPAIVVMDQVTQVRLVTDPGEVAGYAQLHERLRGAAMSDADSAALIRKAADSLASRM